MKRKKKHRSKRHLQRPQRTLPKPDKMHSDTALQINTSAIIYQSELDYISRCILDYPQIETGGQLFGFYTGKRTPVVCYVLGPGPNANHQVTFFNQDIPYLQENGTILAKEFALQHIGEWHSHHCLRLDHPSRHDSDTMITSIRNLRLGDMLLCIGICDAEGATVNGFRYSEQSDGPAEVDWVIKACESPYRRLVDKRLQDTLIPPTTADPKLKGMRISTITLVSGQDNRYLLRAYSNIPL